MNYLVESWGGKYQDQEVSAKKGLNLDKLLEKVLLEAEMLDLKANPNKRRRERSSSRRSTRAAATCRRSWCRAARSASAT